MAKKTEEPKAMQVEDKNTAIDVIDYGDDAGAGYDHQTSKDTTIPFMVQLQALSPIVVEGRDDARPGDWMNTVTGQVYKKEKGFLFVPATTRHKYTIWTGARTEGGKFAGLKDPEDADVLHAVKTAEKFGQNKLPNGHLARETFYVYGCMCSEEGLAETMALIPFTSTKIKPYKTWMTRLQQVRITSPDKKSMTRPPLYGHLTRISSIAKQEGTKHWFVPKIDSADPRGLLQSLLKPDDERFMMAKACKLLVDSGEAKVDFSKQDAAGDEEDSGKAFE